MRKGDLRYRILENLDIQTLEFRGQSSDGFVFHCDKSKEVILWEQAVNQLYISYRMVLTECEELLRSKIDNVHTKLREQNIKFNPVNPFDVIVSPVHNPAKAVHKYDIKTGRFIQTYLSVKSALKDVAPEGTISGTNIHSACIGKIKPNGYKTLSAYGYRWSYEKKNKL